MIYSWDGVAIPPTMNVPVRNYPLPILNEPPMYVIGEKSGQRAMVPNTGESPLLTFIRSVW